MKKIRKKSKKVWKIRKNSKWKNSKIPKCENLRCSVKFGLQVKKTKKIEELKRWNWHVLRFHWEWGKKSFSFSNLRQEFSRRQRPNPCAVSIGRGQGKLLISLQHLHLQNAKVVVPIPRDALHLRVIELKQRPDVETNHAVQQTLRRLGDAVNRHHGYHQEATHIEQKNKPPKIKTDFRKERIEKNNKKSPEMIQLEGFDVHLFKLAVRTIDRTYTKFHFSGFLLSRIIWDHIRLNPDDFNYTHHIVGKDGSEGCGSRDCRRACPWSVYSPIKWYHPVERSNFLGDKMTNFHFREYRLEMKKKLAERYWPKKIDKSKKSWIEKIDSAKRFKIEECQLKKDTKMLF